MDAHDRAPRRLRPAGAGHSITPTSTVGDFLEDWLGAQRSLRPSTYASHEAHVRRYLLPYLGNLPLDGLRPAHIERMYRLQAHPDGHGETPLSIASLRQVHATLASALNTAVKRGLVGANPATPVLLPRAPEPRPGWTEASVMKSSLQLPKFSGAVWIDGVQLAVDLEAATWGDAIDLLNDQYGHGSKFVLRTEVAAVQPD